MTPVALDLRHQPLVREIRCECIVCGVHVTGWQATVPGASCANCGSDRLRPVVLSPRD